jgi:hypothetical protein
MDALIKKLVAKKQLPSKLIICLRRGANTGKTGTILALADILIPQSTRPPVWNTPRNTPVKPYPFTINVEVMAGKVKVGLDGQGDYPDDLYNRLDILANHGCDRIFCTCRSKGGGPAAVKSIAKKFGYAIIWTAPYTQEPPAGQKAPPPNQQALNDLKARHLTDFV